MLKGIKNKKQALRLLYWIIEKKQLTKGKYNYSLSKLDSIVKEWKKEKEEGKEIFKSPEVSSNKMKGDCDDIATLLGSLTGLSNFKIIYLVSKSNGIYHIGFAIQGLEKKETVILDPWLYRGAKKVNLLTDFRSKKIYKSAHKLIVLNCSVKKNAVLIVESIIER